MQLLVDDEEVNGVVDVAVVVCEALPSDEFGWMKRRREEAVSTTTQSRLVFVSIQFFGSLFVGMFSFACLYYIYGTMYTHVVQ